MKKIILLISITILVTSGSFYAGVFFSEMRQDEGSDLDGSIRNSSGTYAFINPLLECETNTLGVRQKHIPFEKKTKELIQKEIQEKYPNIHLSVYFRNLNNGPWFGINENEKFVPASLMKVPLLIMYLRWLELNPSVLDKIITTQVLTQTEQYYKPEQEVIVGSGYTVKELLQYMIRYSNNIASDSLIANIPEQFLNQMLTELSIPLPTNAGYELTVREYSSFFRILYNASYLSRDHSNDALGLLSQAEFSDGITAKIPKNTIVAHKFGERNAQNEDGSTMNQLHDCGIVYYKPYPYLLCIMTRGENTNFNNLASIIQDTSKIIYDQVSSNYKEDR